MKMQWDKIQYLNINLEEKIEIRTKELTAANKRLKMVKDQISKYSDPKVAEKIFKGEFTAKLSHTDMANVGNYGSDGFMEYSAIGLNTNLASRLEQACAPGEIYLSHSSWALVKDEIPCDEVGTIKVKGFHYAIQTYCVRQHEAEPALASLN